MTKFVRTMDLANEDKCKVGEMCGNIMQWILEGRSKPYMAEKLKLSPQMVDRNIDEIIYAFRKHVGTRRFLKILFWK